jgi:hypothetical protein
VIAPIHLPEADLFEVDPDEDGELGYCIGGLEELRVKLYGKLLDFLPREQRLLDLTPGLFGRVLQVRRSVVAAAGLEGQPGRILQRDFELVEAASSFRF